ncbi:hypothetical protein AB0C27_39525 [Nonomuraea sp. NPDC048882]
MRILTEQEINELPTDVFLDALEQALAIACPFCDAGPNQGCRKGCSGE